MNISKELLSAVLGEDVRLGIYTTVESDEDELVQHIMKIEVYGNRVSYWRYYMEWGDNMTMCKCNINIYELAYKCKEWAVNIGFNISSTSGYKLDNTPYAYAISSDGEEFPFIEADTEVEAVFKVCEWILNNKDKLNG